jgi:hypothetical protein
VKSFKAQQRGLAQATDNCDVLLSNIDLETVWKHADFWKSEAKK